MFLGKVLACLQSQVYFWTKKQICWVNKGCKKEKTQRQTGYSNLKSTVLKAGQSLNILDFRIFFFLMDNGVKREVCFFIHTYLVGCSIGPMLRLSPRPLTLITEHSISQRWSRDRGISTCCITWRHTVISYFLTQLF